MSAIRLLLTLVLTTAGLSAPLAQTSQLKTETGPLKVDAVANGLDHPWGLAFLPDGRMLVTERSGTLNIVTMKGEKTRVAGAPEVYARGQGGLLDVALAPDFSASGLIYLSYSEPGGDGAGTAVARGKLVEGRLDDVEVIFRQQPKVSGGAHFGSRLAFAPDGKLFVTMGDRFKFDPAQDLGSHIGKIIRINADGSVPKDNPFVGKSGAKPEIWSYGHRNVQGAAINPETGALWSHEFGPLGGDELNRPEAGKNYGWPLVSWGRHYDGKAIAKPSSRPEFATSIRHWVPAISPSGMTFYTSDRIPGWRGNILIGGLSSEAIIRLTLNGGDVTGEERLDMGARIRNVRQGPDGAVYALTDSGNGRILKLSPAD
jgi:glucose/arabinose dehydrogenase